MGLLFWLLIVLTVITLVGHGIWVMVRGIIRMFGTSIGSGTSRASDRQGAIEGVVCPRCGEAWSLASGVRACPACSWPGSPTGDQRANTRVAVGLLLQRVRRYRQVGLLLAKDGDRLERGLVNEWKRLAPYLDDDLLARPEPLSKPTLRPDLQPRPPEVRPVPDTPQDAPAPRPDLATRAQAYREARAREPVRSAEPEAPEPRQKTSVGGLLSAFMEEKNIRWGELVGGLLIVGCSLALVVGYWDRIAERPFLRFALANGAVAAFFAVGLHADRRWKLPTTAHGLLVIATLLVPLSLLAIVSVGGAVPVGPWLLGGELVALGVFAGLIGWSGRSMGSSAAWETSAGVVVPSAAILAAGRWIEPGVGGMGPVVVGAVILLSHAVATVRGLLARRGQTDLDERSADDLIRTLGLTAFAAAVALWVVLDRAGATAGSLRQLAVLAPMAGAPALAAGLMVWRKSAAPLVGHRVAGGSIAAAGTLVMLSGIALTWPDPAGIVTVAALDGAVLLAIALAFALPAAIALAGGCLALAGLVAAQVLMGPLPWTGAGSDAMAEALTSARSGVLLVPIAVLFEAICAVVLRSGRRPEAKAVGLVSVLAGVMALGLVTWHGLGVPGDPSGATWAYAALAAAALVGSAVTGRTPLFKSSDSDSGSGSGPPAEAQALAWTGSVLMLASLVQGFVFRLAEPWDLALPWSSALLGHATIALGLAATIFGPRWIGEDDQKTAFHVLIQTALVTSVLAAVHLGWLVPSADPANLAVHLLWLSGVWLALACLFVSRPVFLAFQGALTGSVVFAVAAWLTGRPWFETAENPWLDPRVLQAEGIALALLGMAWIGVRIGMRTWNEARPKDHRIEATRWLMEPTWPTFDRFSTWAAVLILVSLALYGVAPGVAQELAPRGFSERLTVRTADEPISNRPVPPSSAFEVFGSPHGESIGSGSWLLLGAVILVLLAGQWERFRRLDLLGLMLASAMVVPLLAGRWEADVAVASALRWGGAIALLALSVPIWARGSLAAVADRIGWRVEPDRVGGLGPMAISTAVAIAAIPLFAMALYVAGAALSIHRLDPGMHFLWMSAGALFAVLAVLGLGSMWVAGIREARDASLRSGGIRVTGGVMTSLGALTLVAVTALVVGSVLSGDPIVGPEPGSFFDRIGLAASYAPPILLVALTLVGYAVRERSSGFALAGGLLLGFGATVGTLLSGIVPARPNDPMLWLRLAQLNAIVGSSYALSWMGSVAIVRRRSTSSDHPAPGAPELAVQVALPAALIGLVLLVGVFGLWMNPWPMPSREAIADPIGWLAIVLTAGAVVSWRRQAGRPPSIGLAAPWVLALAAMLAFGTASQDVGSWLSYHTMMVCLAVMAGGLMLVAWNRRGFRTAMPEDAGGKVITRWSTLATVVLVLFALRAYGSDPIDPLWWTVGGLTSSAALAAALAGWSARRGFLYGSGALLNLSATLWWFDNPSGSLQELLVNLVVVNIIVLAMPVPAWLGIELRAIRPSHMFESKRALTPFHQVASWGSLTALALMVLVWLLADAGGSWPGPEIGIGWVATISILAVALVSGFWDDRARGQVAGLYVLGLCASGWVVAGFDLPTAMLGWIGAVILASYAVIAGALWSARSGLRRLGDRLKVPRSGAGDDPDAGLGWLVPANIGLSAVVVFLAFWVVLTDPGALARFSAAKAGLATALAIGLLARGERRSALRVTALGFGAAGALSWGWAWIDPESMTATLDRAVAALVTFLATAAGYGLVLVKLAPRATQWARAARRVLPTLLGLAGVALLVVIVGELVATASGEVVAMSGTSLVAVAATLLGAAAAALVAAVVPGRDPLALPEHRRTVYVYGAEAMLAMLVLHIRLTMPWLFSGFFTRYWPLIVLGLAFIGVGLGELFRRQGRLVLAGPLERTGALLPVLPLLGAFWMEPRPGEDTLFLVLAGALYATLALMRSSTGFGAVAALAFNAGLWTVLGRRDGFGLLEHPQFWIVPPALCVLVGAYLNRDRLNAAQSAAMRHMAATAVYLSSTADLVLNGVAEDPWLPLVLGGLSLLGIFAGIALRVRGFLLLGVAFLGLSLFAMIWYAAVDLRQTWLWAASGIVVGIMILAAFAIFEKRRQEIRELVDQIKQWEA